MVFNKLDSPIYLLLNYRTTYSQIIIDGLDIEEGCVDGLVDWY